MGLGTRSAGRGALPYNLAMKTLSHACRQPRRRPAFAVAAITSLAMGLGALVTVFTLADALPFRPLAIREPSRVVRVSSVVFDGRPGGVFAPAVDALGQQKDLFAGVCGFLAQTLTGTSSSSQDR